MQEEYLVVYSNPWAASYARAVDAIKVTYLQTSLGDMIDTFDACLYPYWQGLAGSEPEAKLRAKQFFVAEHGLTFPPSRPGDVDHLVAGHNIATFKPRTATPTTLTF